MKRFGTAAFLLLTLLSVAFAQDLKVVRKAIEIQTAKSNLGYKTKDIKAITSILTDDFVAEGPDHHLYSRPQAVAELTEELKAIISIKSISSKIVKIERKKKFVVVTSENVMEGKFKMPDGKISAISLKYNTLEQWQEKGGKWMLHYQRELPGRKQTVNGKAR